MDYRYKKSKDIKKHRNKKKRYHIKPLPIIILLITVLLLVLVCVFVVKTIYNDITAPNSSRASSATSSDTASDNKKGESTQSEKPKKESSQFSSYIETASEFMNSSKAPTAESSDASSDASSGASSDASSAASSNTAAVNFENDGTGKDAWNLILLNPDNSIKQDLTFAKTKFDAQYVDSRAAGAYQAMFDAAKKDGITLYLRSGYRSMATQKINYDSAVARYVKQGKSNEEAVELTDQYYTKPGCSEHHSGLAFDIITPEYHKTTYSLDDRFAQTDAYAWLIKNCSDYGFILRYPADKKPITKINYEPWHYRYVGKKAAKEIEQNGLCFEEYAAQL